MRIRKFIIPSVLSVLLVCLLLRSVTLQQVATTLSGLPSKTIILAFLIYLLLYAFRAMRLRILLDRIGFLEMYGFVCVHNLMVGLLPLRTGELSLLFLAKQHKKSKVLSALLVARYFDLVAVIVLFGIALLIKGSYERQITLSFVIAALLLILLVIGFAAGSLLLSKTPKSLLRNRPIKYIFEKGREVIAHIKESKGRLPQLMISSLLVWLSSYAMSYLIVVGLGIRIDAASIIMAFSLITIFSVLPIHGLVNFGTLEAGWAVAFIFFGVAQELAISSGFAFHIINILFFAVMGAAGYAILKLSRDNK